MEINLSRRAVSVKGAAGILYISEGKGFEVSAPVTSLLLNGFVWRDHTCCMMGKKGDNTPKISHFFKKNIKTTK